MTTVASLHPLYGHPVGDRAVEAPPTRCFGGPLDGEAIRATGYIAYAANAPGVTLDMSEPDTWMEAPMIAEYRLHRFATGPGVYHDAWVATEVDLADLAGDLGATWSLMLWMTGRGM